MAERSSRWSREDYRQHLDWALQEGTTPNGVFGSKLMWNYFNDFLELMRGIPRFGGMGDGSLLNAAFPDLHYVFVSRSDKVRQAVSLWRALQTWVWRKEADAPADEPLPAQRSVYSFDAIDHLLDQLRRHEDGWRGFFFRIGRQPLQLYYEEIAGDLEGAVMKVIDGIGLERPEGWSVGQRAAPSRQSDDLSESWVQSYLEDVSRR
jgi:LPS sulfotransferase NodH